MIPASSRRLSDCIGLFLEDSSCRGMSGRRHLFGKRVCPYPALPHAPPSPPLSALPGALPTSLDPKPAGSRSQRGCETESRRPGDQRRQHRAAQHPASQGASAPAFRKASCCPTHRADGDGRRGKVAVTPSHVIPCRWPSMPCCWDHSWRGTKVWPEASHRPRAQGCTCGHEEESGGTIGVGQMLRSQFPMQKTWIPSLVGEPSPTRPGAAEPT